MNHSTLEIISILKEKEEDFLNIKSFSSKPGIYAIFYIGKDFPILGDEVKKHQIIYIGKTEKSQDSRDAKTHFSSGKTGSSTVRKSIGSILCGFHNLKPIPRNDKDYEKGRNSHFMFDEPSEEIITKWMQSNLALSFYDYSKSHIEIDSLETEIIHGLIPVLNIDYKNPKNPYKKKIKSFRKICALAAMESVGFYLDKSSKLNNSKQKKSKPFSKTISNSFVIKNISLGDARSKEIRILVNGKNLFPAEIRGQSKTYGLTVMYKEKSYYSTYTIGSKDGKSRSGILELKEDLYTDILKIKSGDSLKITKTSENLYTIERI